MTPGLGDKREGSWQEEDKRREREGRQRVRGSI